MAKPLAKRVEEGRHSAALFFASSFETGRWPSSASPDVQLLLGVKERKSKEIWPEFRNRPRVCDNSDSGFKHLDRPCQMSCIGVRSGSAESLDN